MLKNKSITFFVKRYVATTVYLSVKETQDLITQLTASEAMLYTEIKGMVLESPDASQLKNAALAARLNTPERTIINAKASLKKKGYMVITFGTDGDGDTTAQVYLGKDQVELYNLGLKVEITDARAYKKLLKRFPIDNPTLSQEERIKLVKAFNEYYENNREEFK